MDPSREAAFDAPPAPIAEYAGQTVTYVQVALGIELEYDSETLPVLDHYLRQVPETRPEMRALVASTAGAYFGEVVRRRLGGHWDLTAGDPAAWRIVLPTGLTFSPAGVVASAIDHSDPADLDAAFDAPPRLRPYLEDILARMGEVTEEEFYSLCGRYDTLEHVHASLLAVAAELAKQSSN